MFFSRLFGAVAFCLCLLALARPASARPFRVWFADELAQKSDVVVMATVLSNHDASDFTKETHKPEDLVPVITIFGVDAVLKGDMSGNIRSKEGLNIEVEHLRYFDPMSNITIIDGAFITHFDPKNHPQYLLFLVKGSNNTYRPVTGQYDDFQSFVSLSNYFGFAKERLPVVPSTASPIPQKSLSEKGNEIPPKARKMEVVRSSYHFHALFIISRTAT